MKRKIEEALDTTLNGLKPFQLATVNHCVGRFNENQTKVLVADEVGLGKTLVAKGVIAKLYRAHIIDNPNKPFKVIYVCSNQAIASQNIKKLNIFSSIGDTASVVIEDNRNQDRITLLAYDLGKNINDFKFSIKAITPGTSFSTLSTGKKEERHLLFRLLRNEIKNNDKALSRFIKGNKKGNLAIWDEEIKQAINADTYEKGTERHPKIHSKVPKIFLKSLRDEIPVDILKDINKADHLKIAQGTSIIRGLNIILKDAKYFYKNRYDQDWFYRPYSKLVRLLRYKLAEACTILLDADLFILDEFQRFNQVLEYDDNSEIENDGLALGQKILNNDENKVLMLSATPFKPYSTDFDENNGEYHSKEFDKVISFLARNKDDDSNSILEGINGLKNEFFQYLRNPDFTGDKWGDAIVIREKLQTEYKKLMCRTERSIAIKDSNELVEERLEYLKVNEHDIRDFVIFDGIVQYLNDKGKRLNSPIEYSKSSPFALSFLKGYVHWNKLIEEYNSEDNSEIRKIIRSSGDAWLDPKTIDAYKNVIPTERSQDPPNAKLRSLQTEMKQGYNYLWIPASLNYYQPYGAYKETGEKIEGESNSDSYTKMLIFSSWKMVPRMIAGIVSYEADRINLRKIQELRKDKEIVPYSKNVGKNRYPLTRINAFQIKDDYSGKNDDILSIPSLFLAELYDPQENLNHKESLNDIKRHLKSKIEDLFSLNRWNDFSQNETGGNSRMWTWLSYQIVDTFTEKPDPNWTQKRNHKGTIYNQLFNAKKYKGLSDQEITKWQQDVSRLDKNTFDDLLDNLASHCLGNPAICTFRALKKLYPDFSNDDLMLSAHTIALGFLSFFDKPESIAIIDINSSEIDYHKKIIDYCISGNLQAVLDEYFYMLYDSSGINSPFELADNVQTLLKIRVGTTNFETRDSLRTQSGKKDKKSFSLRTSFARNFGDKSATVEDSNREINLREAFNSPFRPFVLATTSIGQEGLDFHYYSHKIMHWNLPYNPIDFEQREGRINRYKSHVIRRNIVEQIDFKKLNPRESPWIQMFKITEENEKSKTGLIPFWHFSNSKYKIQRLVPLHPFSKDVKRYYELLKVLKYYRLTFGQPSQSEIVEMLSQQNLTPENRLELMINLAPELV